MRRRIIATSIVVFLWSAPVALAHEDDFPEPLPLPLVTSWWLDSWRKDWAMRAVGALDRPLLGEWHWYRDNYFPPPPQIEPTARVEAVERSTPVVRSSVAYGPGVEQWRGLVTAYWPAELVEWAMAIIRCESVGDPYAYNPRSGAAGLFQFLRSTWDRGPAPALGLGSYDSGAAYDPETNIRAAAWLYANWGGTSQWSCKA